MSSPATKAPAAPASAAMPLLRVGPHSAPLLSEFEAQLQAQHQATVAAQAPGTVTALHVKAGDNVRAGQVLALIDGREAATAVARSQAALAQAQAEAAQSQAAAQRSRDLRAQGFISQAALDAALTQTQAGAAGVQAAQAALAQARIAQGHTSAQAPFAGVVAATHVQAGDLAHAGRALVTLYTPGALRAVVALPLSNVEAARSAASAGQVQIQLPGGRWVQPVRQTLLSAADAATQTVEWRLDLSPADAAPWLPGQTVRVRLQGAAPAAATAPQRLLLPESAVLRRGELTAVYVAHQGTFSLRAVRLGARHRGSDGSTQWEVLAGLKAGEQIASDALRAGMAVAPTP